ncbi:MAG: uncharacterized protein PWP48_1981 [Clostridiales bacterium]|jgi:hypothetical protein|nr:uncharacterized protein [Clostridiales bacterium]MDK2902808.1 uncharacterized protein [Clostridiales bacterium]MDK2992748.1 uncharacterized protein [Clostridiales bacterium]
MNNKKEIIEEIKERLIERINPESIILFGSTARGTDVLDSDIDILVVWDEGSNLPNIQRRIKLRDAIGYVDVPVDLLTCTRDELKAALSDSNSFTSAILKEGKIIYGRFD